MRTQNTALECRLSQVDAHKRTKASINGVVSPTITMLLSAGRYKRSNGGRVAIGHSGSSQGMNELTHIVSTRRCLLRNATTSDYEALATAIGTSEFPSELPLAGLHRQGRLKAWLSSMIETSARGRACLLSVDLRTGEKCVGQVSLVQKGESGSWNLAFWLHPSHWGRGLALEGARAAVKHAFTAMTVEEVWAGAAPWNQRSIKTLLELGLKPIEDGEVSAEQSESEKAFRAFSLLRDHWVHSQRER